MAFKPNQAKVTCAARADAAELLIGEMTLQAKGGPNVEDPTAAMFEAVLSERDDPHIRLLLEDAGESTIIRRGIKSAAAISALRTSLTSYFYARYEEQGQEFTDAHRTSREHWQEPFAALKDDLRNWESMAVGALHAGITYMTASTPVAERYYPAALLGQLTRDRHPQGKRVLDIGPSIGVGALQLMYSDEYSMAFDNVSIGSSDEDVTKNVNEILSRTSPFREIVGVDTLKYYDEERQRFDQERARFSLSGLRPSERNNPAYYGRIKKLMEKKQKGAPGYDPNCRVKFHQGNLLKAQDLDDFKQQFGEKFDLITVNYVTQEMPPQQQLKLHEVALELRSEDGLIVYIHQAHMRPGVTQPASIGNVKHYETYATLPWRSNMHVDDGLHPVTGVQEMMGFYDNRCRLARIGGGKLVVNGAVEPLSDLVKKG